MSRLTVKIKEEVIEMIPPTLYFFVILHLVAFVRVLMTNPTSNLGRQPCGDFATLADHSVTILRTQVFTGFMTSAGIRRGA
jgi:hypothetical protein